MSGRLLPQSLVCLSVAAVLRAHGAELVDFEAFLDQYLEHIDEMAVDKVASEYAAFQGYYFDHNHDPERQARFAARLGD